MAKSKKKVTKKNTKKQSTPSNWSWILPLVFIGIGAIIFLQSGFVGRFLNQLLSLLFGQWFLVVVGVVMVFCALSLFIKNENPFTFGTCMAYICLLLCFLLISCIPFAKEQFTNDALIYLTENFGAIYSQEVNSYGGVLGLCLYGVTVALVGQQGLYIVITILAVIAVTLMVFSPYWKAVWYKLSQSVTLPSLYANEEDEIELEQLKTKESVQPIQLEEVKQTKENTLEKQVTYLNPNLDAPIKSIYIDTNEDIVADNIHPGESNTDDVDEISEDKMEDISLLTETSASTTKQTLADTRSFFIDADPIEPIVDEIEQQPLISNKPLVQDTVEYSAISNNTDSIMPAASTTQVADTQLNVPSSNSIGATIARLAIEKRNQESERIKPPSDGPYKIPPLTLLEPSNSIKRSDANIKAARYKGTKLVDVLNTFGISTQLVATHIGPAVTKFEVRPEANVKVSKISNLSDNIKMELQARQLRIEAPIPGHNAVGVEIPNEESTIVKMKEVILSETMRKDNSPMLFALGKNLFGEPVSVRLDKMPHLLIAGATGSGKSVCMNAIITSLLLRAHPDQLKLLLIDPKKVEFTPYHEIPHLIGPVINDPTQANTALKAIVKEMDDRYNLFALAGVRKLDDFNALAQKDPSLQPLPYIVVIIDELADLMIVAGKEVEASIQRITQLARAAGIHLIVATQRPSTDVITGVVKSNIPSRIAFAVSSSIDSRTILDHSGAEKLLGYGDMLYVPMGEQTPIRVQGVYVSDSEVNAICDYAKKQRSPRYADAFVRLEGVEGNDGTSVTTIEADPLYMEARDYVVQVQKASTSLLQRRFQIGYNRAARIIEALEENGIIGPAQGSKPREVYMQNENNL